MHNNSNSVGKFWIEFNSTEHTGGSFEIICCFVVESNLDLNKDSIII